ncbi:MAG: hypothetical protein E7279_01570 [Lachnospiraceae bacterium]|nr:hypothetical protein [Lachnospiraceae bacterium]
MELREIESFKRYEHKRYAFDRIKTYINDKTSEDILVIYGLRRTGKTVLMEQILQDYPFKDKCVFYEVSENDNMSDVINCVINAKNKGINIICIDEITKAKDFPNSIALLSDVYVKNGMKILLTGTDSLGFYFAGNEELFDRNQTIDTTYISFAEHCCVLNTNDMDNYIKYGGLMSRGKDRVKDYKSACKYLDSAVASNIANSIAKCPYYENLNSFSKKDITIIIERMVELYSGIWNKEKLQNELSTATVNYPISKLNGLVDADIIDSIVMKKNEITKDFVRRINASGKLSTNLTIEAVNDFEKILRDMQVLSIIKERPFTRINNSWISEQERLEYYIVQPAIKFYHLKEALKFIENESYYSILSEQNRNIMKDKLEEKILGDMTEQIVLFDTMNVLDNTKYEVYKPVFYDGHNKIGEYDMLIWDKSINSYWGFEIKHTTEPYLDQNKHLINEDFKKAIDYQFGNRENVCVLYRGDTDDDLSNNLYVNITDFLSLLNKYKDLNLVFDNISQTLSNNYSKKQCR